MGAEKRFDGSDLLRLREALGWSQTQLGRACGVSGAYICQLEKAPHPLTPAMRYRVRRAIMQARGAQDALLEELT